MKPDNRRLVGFIQPLPIPNKIWEDVSMDFVTSLPNAQGYIAVLVVVDCLSKQAHFGALTKSYSTGRVAELFSQIV